MTYWRLHYHIIWATFERQGSITPDREKMIYGVLYKKAKEMGVKVHAAGNTEDHIHIVASIPPQVAVAEFIRQVKGASSFAVNRMAGNQDHFEWQEGYGILTIGERSLTKVMAYAAGQKEHHRENRSVNILERMDQGRQRHPGSGGERRS